MAAAITPSVVATAKTRKWDFHPDAPARMLGLTGIFASTLIMLWGVYQAIPDGAEHEQTKRDLGRVIFILTCMSAGCSLLGLYATGNTGGLAFKGRAA